MDTDVTQNQWKCWLWLRAKKKWKSEVQRIKLKGQYRVDNSSLLPPSGQKSVLTASLEQTSLKIEFWDVEPGVFAGRFGVKTETLLFQRFTSSHRLGLAASAHLEVFIFIATCPWKSVWLYLSACVCCPVEQLLWIYFCHNRRKKAEEQITAQSDGNPILLGEKVNVNAARCKFRHWISCKMWKDSSCWFHLGVCSLTAVQQRFHKCWHHHFFQLKR